ncbi:GAF domain-containing protein [Streptomyces sp. S3(2020)]|uniref:GAF domain-containing protein n=1 Tax=Streptomyces sp. S3(2020) TaxID=2732044 RepID=UPI001489DA6E|nr:GAF domain-containing protein [Streptomyces sp. S3(2020)]
MAPHGLLPHQPASISATTAQLIAVEQGRQEVIARFGIAPGPDDHMDHLAREMAERTGLAYGFVNIFWPQQTFIGLHQPPHDSGLIPVGRSMSRRHGWCPEVIARRKALPLPDVYASPRFVGNHVTDALGIRSYFGAPLIDWDTGIAWGTVCVIDPEPRPLRQAQQLLDIVKDTGSTVVHTLTAQAPAH